ncbi:MAG: phosphate/phosphite/phosphonate ABC transporter substrate-binding protein [Deltaproteobacteria bacterium]|nr:phosphate/phosphite/phosphonate ABC transporter substrate-binding protein [Deltaproteobacteria bacterium]
MYLSRILSALLLLCLLALASCARQGAEPPVQETPMPKLTIGLPPERNIFRQIERYEPLMRYVGKKAGVEFELKVFPRYANIVSDFESMELDGAFYGSFTYVIAAAQMGHRVIARPEDPKGISTARGMIFVRKDSKIRSVKDMKGKKMVIADYATTGGCLLTRVFFFENGIDPTQGYFGELYVAGTHEDAIHDVIEGVADIGAAKDSVYRRMWNDESPTIQGRVRAIAFSPEVPENGLSFRPGVDGSLVLKVKEVLLTMDRDPEGAAILEKFGARRFIETKDEDFDVVRGYSRRARLDPATLNCRKPSN